MFFDIWGLSPQGFMNFVSSATGSNKSSKRLAGWSPDDTFFLSPFPSRRLPFFSRTISICDETWWATSLNILSLFGIKIWSYWPPDLAKIRPKNGHGPAFRLEILWLRIALNCFWTLWICRRMVAARGSLPLRFDRGLTKFWSKLTLVRLGFNLTSLVANWKILQFLGCQ